MRWFHVLVGVAWAVAVYGAPITVQSAISQVDAGGVTQAEQSVSVTDGFASSQAIWPAGTGIAQARTAARSRDVEIAANAMVFSESFSPQAIDLALSQAFYAIELEPLVGSSVVALDFFLPSSYIEIVSNAEIPFNVMEASFLADLRVCQQSICGPGDQRFHFQVHASSSWQNSQHSVTVNGDPGLDLTPLANPTVTHTPQAFLRTYLVEFPEFQGHLDLSNLSPGQTVRVEYVLQARASGLALLSSAISAINDPFAIDTDPVQQGAPLVLSIDEASQIPEPGAGVLVCVGLLLLIGRRR